MYLIFLKKKIVQSKQYTRLNINKIIKILDNSIWQLKPIVEQTK